MFRRPSVTVFGYQSYINNLYNRLAEKYQKLPPIVFEIDTGISKVKLPITKSSQAQNESQRQIVEMWEAENQKTEVLISVDMFTHRLKYLCAYAELTEAQVAEAKAEAEAQGIELGDDVDVAQFYVKSFCFSGNNVTGTEVLTTMEILLFGDLEQEIKKNKPSSD